MAEWVQFTSPDGKQRYSEEVVLVWQHGDFVVNLRKVYPKFVKDVEDAGGMVFVNEVWFPQLKRQIEQG